MLSVQGSLSLIALFNFLTVLCYLAVIKLNGKHLRVAQDILEVRNENYIRESHFMRIEKELLERSSHLNHIEFLNKEEFERANKNLQQREILVAAKERKKPVSKKTGKNK